MQKENIDLLDIGKNNTKNQNTSLEVNNFNFNLETILKKSMS